MLTITVINVLALVVFYVLAQYMPTWEAALIANGGLVVILVAVKQDLLWSWPIEEIIIGSLAAFFPLVAVITIPWIAEPIIALLGRDIITMIGSIPTALPSVAWLSVAIAALAGGVGGICTQADDYDFPKRRVSLVILINYVISFGLLGKIVYDDWAWLWRNYSKTNIKSNPPDYPDMIIRHPDFIL